MSTAPGGVPGRALDHRGPDHRGLDHRALVTAVLLAAAAGWVALAVTGHAAGHQHLGGGDLAAGPAAALAGWTLMVIAMMLPPALPLLDLVRRLAAARTDPGPVVVAAIAGYLAVWLVTGAVLVGGDAVLHATLGHSAWLHEHPNAVLGAALLLAGGYQFTPLKDACLRACRGPRGFAVAHWHGVRPPAVEAAVIGVAYGASCVGCCWALMTVGFAVGAAALPAMVALTALTVAERLSAAGRRLVRPAGLVALLAGLALLAVPLPALTP